MFHLWASLKYNIETIKLFCVKYMPFMPAGPTATVYSKMGIIMLFLKVYKLCMCVSKTEGRSLCISCMNNTCILYFSLKYVTNLNYAWSGSQKFKTEKITIVYLITRMTCLHLYLHVEHCVRCL